MILSDFSRGDVSNRLRGGGLCVQCGPFVVRVFSPLELVAEGLLALYGSHGVLPSDGFADFSFAITPPLGLRRWVRPQVRFYFDGTQPFEPLPLRHAYQLFEWSLNWCISTQAQFFLIVHGAVVEREGRALVLPGKPGAGKSTLCAALVCRGWRLFSDELVLLSLENDSVRALARPVSLKNESIDVIRRFDPSAFLHRPVHDTLKGTIAQMKPRPEHVRRMAEPARPAWVIFPRYRVGAAAELKPKKKGDAFMELAGNCFNYGLLAAEGFDRLGRLVNSSDCYDFAYGDLEEAVDLFEKLALPRQGE